MQGRNGQTIWHLITIPLLPWNTRNKSWKGSLNKSSRRRFGTWALMSGFSAALQASGGLCHWLIVEFIPKEDPQVLRMLATRKDIFPNYTQAGFEQGFGEDFTIIAREQLQDSSRVLYLMERKN